MASVDILRSWRARVALVFVLAFLWRLALLLVVRTEGDLTSFRYHEAAALNLLAGGGLSVPYVGHPGVLVPITTYPPGYALFLAGIYGVLGPVVRDVQLVQSLLGAVGVVLLVFCVRYATQREGVAFWSGVVAALLPITAAQDVYLNSHTATTIFILLLSLFLWYRAWNVRSLASCVPLGIALGAGGQFRSEALPIIPLLSLLLLADGISWNSLKRVGVTLLCGIVVLIPWTLRNGMLFGEFSPAEGGSGGVMVSVIGKFYPDPQLGFGATDDEILAGDKGDYTDMNWPDPYSRDRVRLRKVFDFIAQNPDKYALVLIRNLPIAWFGHQLYLSRDPDSLQAEIREGRLVEYARHNLLGLADRVLGVSMALTIFSLAVLGIFASKNDWRPWLPFYGVIAYYLVVFVPLGALGRYTIPAYVLMIPFAVTGFGTLHRWVARGVFQRPAPEDVGAMAH